MTQPKLYKRHRFPHEIIQYAVWLYHRFALSHRDIEDLMSQRGVEVSYEAIRLWCNKFGKTGTDHGSFEKSKPRQTQSFKRGLSPVFTGFICYCLLLFPSNRQVSTPHPRGYTPISQNGSIAPVYILLWTND